MCIIIIIALFVLAIIVIAKNIEKKDFNDGFCPYCETKLRNFDTSSQGDRGYICDKCTYSTWCSYNVDKNYKQ